jgi:hypothetical protein
MGLFACLLITLGLDVPAVTQDQPARAPALGKNWRHDYADFLSKPVEMQQRIRQLDRDLREEDSATQARLFKVMQRYSDWLKGLADDDRHYVETADSTSEKLRRVREVREKQWVASLPQIDRDRLGAAKSADERQKLIADIHERERQADVEWHWTLAKTGDRQEMIRQAIANWRLALQPKLKPEDRPKLREGMKQQRPAQIKILVELSQKYDVPIPQVFQQFPLAGGELPPVADKKLLLFLQTQLAESVRKQYEVRLRDPEQLDQALADLVALYWQQHPAELLRIREADRRKQNKGPTGKPANP